MGYIIGAQASSSPTLPTYLSRIQIPVAYDPDATCEILDEMIRDIIQPQDYIKNTRINSVLLL